MNNICSTYIVDQKDESFYTVSWACNLDGTPFLVAGGINGIIRVIDAGNEKINKVPYNQSMSSMSCTSVAVQITTVIIAVSIGY